MTEFRLPDLGEGVHEGQVMRLMVSEGESVNEDQHIMEVETDKAAVEIPSPVTGRVHKVHVEERQLVHVGDVMFTFETTGEASSPATPAASDATSATPVTAPAAPTRIKGRRKPASPSVRRMARQMGIDLANVDGSGPGGRVTRRDLEQHAAPSVSTSTPPPTAVPAPAQPVPATPVTTMPPRQAAAAPLALDIDGRVDSDRYGEIVRAPLTQARKSIAQVMSTSWTTIPHVTDCNDADITELETLRKGFHDPSASERRITTLAFVIRAVCRALSAFPILNAALEESSGEIIFHRYVNIGIGVDTPRGLVAPVIHNADNMGVGELADHLQVITDNARNASFAIEDTRGGTYTISNAGAMGRTRYSTPIITPGQVACLAVGRARKMPWVVEDEIVARMILPLSHSMDHRLVDGGREVPFIGHVIDDLENPMRFML
ncbi:MAG: dihydrolipoamide acetyltransferase family protein [Planctomycetota bacterium]|nr:dihydrolipoamide acetyltransferase family protein [Planctomycetota bacterium]